MKIRYVLLVSGVALGAVAVNFCPRPGYAFPASAFSADLPGTHMRFATAKTSESLEEGAETFVQTMANRGLAFLSDDALPADKKAAEFRDLLKDSFDLKTISRFALGRYWRMTTPEQKDEYYRLFVEMIVDVYTVRFGEYNGQKFEVSGSRAISDKDVLVNSQIVSEKSGSSPIEVDWRVRHKNGGYQIIDVMVEGVSMSVTQRSDFAGVIQKGGGKVEALLEHLRNRT